MRRFGGLVVGTLLLTGCGAGGGLASTTASATVTSSSSGISTTVATQSAASQPNDGATAVALVRAVMEGDQQGIRAAEPGGQVDPYYQRFIMMSSPTLDGQPTKYMSGVDAFHVNVRVKTQDGQMGTLKFDVLLDTVGTHKVTAYNSGLYPDSGQ